VRGPTFEAQARPRPELIGSRTYAGSHDLFLSQTQIPRAIENRQLDGNGCGTLLEFNPVQRQKLLVNEGRHKLCSVSEIGTPTTTYETRAQQREI
jgi:hypothetical protein